MEDNFSMDGAGWWGDGTGGNTSDGERQVPVRGPGVGDPCPRGYIPRTESQLARYSLTFIIEALNTGLFSEPFFKGLPGSTGTCNCVIFLMKQSVVFCLCGGLGFCRKAGNAVEKCLPILCRWMMYC